MTIVLPSRLCGRYSEFPLRLRFASENCRGGAAEVFAVIDRADACADAELDVRHLARAAFTADLPHRFENVQHAACRRRLTAVDHAAAGLNRQIAFESK